MDDLHSVLCPSSFKEFKEEIYFNIQVTFGSGEEAVEQYGLHPGFMKPLIYTRYTAVCRGVCHLENGTIA